MDLFERYTYKGCKMRYVKYIFYIIFISFLILELKPVIDELTKDNDFKTKNINILKNTKVSVSYLLYKDESITFAIPSGANILRILSNINIPIVNTDENIPFSYSLKYQLLDKEDNVVFANVYHHYTKIVRFLDQETKENINTRFYTNNDILPASTRMFFIPLEFTNDAYKLKVSINSLDKRAQSLVLRSYHQVENSPRKLFDMWRRLKEKTKESLAKGNVYPYTLLTADEKKYLLSKSWKPFGPLGVLGKDYNIKNLYTKLEIDELQEIEIDLRKKLPAFKRIVFDLPLGVNKIKTSLVDRNNSTIANVTINHYDINNTITRDTFIQTQKSINKSKGGKGRLEIYSDKDIYYDIVNEQQESLLPRKIFQKVNQINSNNSTVFMINHISNKSTPIKMAYRYFKEENRDAMLYVKIGSEKFQLQVDSSKSFHEGLINDNENNEVGVESIKYFDIPVGIKEISFKSSNPILLNVAVLVPTLPHTRNYNQNESIQRINWHTVNPIINIDEHVIYKTPLIKEKIVNEKYSHKELNLNKRSASRDIFIPKDINTSIKYYQYNSIYTKIKNNKKYNGEFSSSFGVGSVTSRIVYKKQNNKRTKISIYIDDILVTHKILENKKGSISLPHYTQGKHSLKVKTDSSTNLWIKGFFLKENPEMFLKRYIYNIQNEISYKIVKNSDDPLVISFKIYREKEIEKSMVNVTLHNIDKNRLKVSTKYTFKNKEYHIYKESEGKEFESFSLDQNLVESGSFYFTIGDDIPKGEYVLSFNTPDDESLYIYAFEGQDTYNKKVYMYKEN